jgi:hypothetical protein
MGTLFSTQPIEFFNLPRNSSPRKPKGIACVVVSEETIRSLMEQYVNYDDRQIVNDEAHEMLKIEYK